VLRRSWDANNEEVFRRHQQRRDLAAAALAAADEAVGPNQLNPLLPSRDSPTPSEHATRISHSDSTSSVSSALLASSTAPGSATSTSMTGVGDAVADTDLDGNRKQRTESVDSG